MTNIRATIQGRRLELDVPADWPDGIEVEIHPLGHRGNGDADSMSTDEIAQTLAEMDRVKPLDMTDAERDAWDAQRQARKELEKAQFIEHVDKLRRAWE